MFSLIYTLEKLVSLLLDEDHHFPDEEILEFGEAFYSITVHTTQLSELLGLGAGVSGIYLIRFPNGKVYLGSTRNFVNRRSNHLYELKKGHHNPGFRDLMETTPPEQVKFTRIAIGANRETLFEMEQTLYEFLGDRGCLLNVGTDAKAAFKGRPLSEATRKAAAIVNSQLPPHPNRIKATKEKWKDEEFRQRHKEAMNKLWSNEDYKQRQRDLRLGIPHDRGPKIAKALKGGIKKNSRSVSVKGVVYPTINHAVEATGIKGGTLRRWLDSPDVKYKEYFFV